MKIAVVWLLIASPVCGAEIRLAEIFYNPPSGEQEEFLELEVTAGGDLTGFSVRGGVDFVFPEGSFAIRGQIIVLAKNPAFLRSRYGGLSQHCALFAYSGVLDRGRETLRLCDAAGGVIESLTYESDPPWPPLADGFGKALVRVCLEADPSDPFNWICLDPTPGGGEREEICPPPVEPAPPVVINEIMYHPRGGTVDERRYEFIELYNRSSASIDLSGWRLAGAVTYDFPPQSSIDAWRYFVIAKDPGSLRSAYPGIDSPVLGPYSGDLQNGGAKIVLIGPDGRGVDSVTYDDDPPWPVRADGYGDIPGRGASLERLCAEKPAGLVANWVASPADGATPGRENSRKVCELPPIALSVETAPASLRPGMEIQVRAILSRKLPAENLRLVFMACTRPEEPSEPEAEPVLLLGDTYEGIIAPQPPGTRVRYRLEVRKEERWIPLAPRPDDPRRAPWFGLFLPAREAGRIRTYHIFIDSPEWSRMIQNARSGRAVGNDIVPIWNRSVPAAFAFGNRLYDIEIRYQGSQWHRLSGFPIEKSFNCRRPSAIEGNPLKLLGFRIGFPRYDQFEGRQALFLNKVHYVGAETLFYHGFQTLFGYRLFGLAGVPAPEARFVSVRLNGCAYHVMVEVERPGEEMMERFFEGEGDLFKAVGCPRGISWGFCGGPYDWADGRPLSARAPWSKEEVYLYNYERKTRRFDGPQVLIELIESLDRASRESVETLRAELAAKFDVKEVLRYLAVSNWGCAWDDVWQNYYLFFYHGDGKWRILPWDMDEMFGGPCCCARVDARTSVWRGKRGDPDNWQPDPGMPVFNRFKDYFFRAFPDAYLFTLVKLNNEVFDPEKLGHWIDEIEAVLSSESENSLLPIQDSIPTYAETLRNFVRERRRYVNAQLIPIVDPGGDVLTEAGKQVIFDASKSSPPPGRDVEYTWSNGMKGATPAFTFNEAGTKELELTITKTLRMGTEETFARRSASIVVRVLPAPRCFFRARGGTCAFEAESFQANHPGFRVFAGAYWKVVEDKEASEGRAVRAFGSAVEAAARYSLIAPELNWWVLPDRTGKHVLWIRLRGGERFSETTVAVGFDHVAPSPEEFLLVEGTRYRWIPVPVTIAAARPVLISLWLANHGVTVDKAFLTADPSLFVPPPDLGPESTEAACADGRFLRGDTTGDRTIDLADPIAVLAYLFSGLERLSCPDAADANDDGTLNLGDPVYLLQFLFAGGAPPRPPYPEPGVDPTPDDLPPCNEGP